MPTHVTVAEVERDFSSYIDRVAHDREHFVMMREGKPVAELRPLPLGRRARDFPDIFAALPRLGAAEAEAFGHDIDEAREELDAAAVRSPCDS